MFFNSNIKFNNSDNYGKFFGSADMYYAEYTFDNIHVYHHENDLTNATADQSFWNDFKKMIIFQIK
ncbi:hypothetical protein [Campylobacter lari]|uniref:hypothetical protein n=1 Tax=Campylobacter lari TaxID=201 RepID=UPI0012885B27|nr:hypothetical protein [Campylobacter lari]EAL4712222.1 hypothetical protein [Campylobacter lari]MCR2076514.1 hypothetical protein [Campylobacter lari subsp. concheus]MCR2084214.1 hypothetical protein [Campylobacter lari subsp. concheus]MCR2085794.1 hypothetical protein [Campylobacter lari subsp. concheus]